MNELGWTIVTQVGVTLVTCYVAVRAVVHQFNLGRHGSDVQAALALKIDLDRMKRSLGANANVFGSRFHGMTIEPPRFHRWSDDVITRLAATDPRIVAEALGLDDDLNNFAASVKSFHLANDITEKAVETKREAQRAFDAIDDDTIEMNEALRRAIDLENAKDAIRDLKEPAQEYLRMMREYHKKALVRIDLLIDLATAIVARPSPELFPAPGAPPLLRDANAGGTHRGIIDSVRHDDRLTERL